MYQRWNVKEESKQKMRRNRLNTLAVVDGAFVPSLLLLLPDRVRNGVLHKVKEIRKILRTTKRKKANWICHILRTNF
jgi:hypothetical protein